MADDKQKREQELKRKLQALKDVAREKSESESKPNARPEKKESLFGKMSKGKLGRFGKAAMAAGMLAGTQPGGAQMSEDAKIRDEMRKNQQQATTQQYEGLEQNQAQKMFSEDIGISERTEPFSMPFEGVSKQNKQPNASEYLNHKQSPGGFEDHGYANKIPTPGGGRALGEIVQPKPLDPEQESKKNVTNRVGGTLTLPGGGIQTVGKGIEKDGRTVEQGSEGTTDATDKAKEIKQSKVTQQGDAPGERYMNLARQLKEAKKKAQEGNIGAVISGTVNTVSQLGTARALQWSWISLIPTFGLTILYIDFHFVARYFFHSEKFCAFGEEWMIIKGEASGPQALQRSVGGSLESVEIMGFIVANLLVAIVIVFSLIVGYFVLNPIEGFQLLTS